jgi:hypothetical protein
MALIVPDRPHNGDDSRHDGCCLRVTLDVTAEGDGRPNVIERR